ASGIGRRTTERFVEEGARVAMTDINAEGLAAAAAPLGDAVITLHHDITDEQSWIDVVGQAVDQLGSINILVNSAGTGKATNIEDTTLEDWHRVMAINADGTFLGCKHGVIAMKETGGGAIVNLSSVSGLIGGHNMTAYNASKGAVRLLTKSVALHCARKGYNIRCNSVHPAFILTPMVEAMIERSRDPASTVGKLEAQIPLGHMGEATDVADMIVYLSGDESRFVTGAEFVIDGGLTAG
ncbi:MAG: SDR family oxidoreductase, partial [Rhodospirillaceae bacterium]|nr:SDR family oxidoreductase [Rhodospirillaceae bacterium]